MFGLSEKTPRFNTDN